MTPTLWPCNIPNCPALIPIPDGVCSVHRTARLAADLHIAKSAKGKGGELCVNCRRVFKPDDYVNVEMVSTTKHCKAVHGYAHVQCEPKAVSRKDRATEPKPLLTDELS
jgi:hypothetical protein